MKIELSPAKFQAVVANNSGYSRAFERNFAGKSPAGSLMLVLIDDNGGAT